MTCFTNKKVGISKHLDLTSMTWECRVNDLDTKKCGMGCLLKLLSLFANRPKGTIWSIGHLAITWPIPGGKKDVPWRFVMGVLIVYFKTKRIFVIRCSIPSGDSGRH